MPSRDYHEEEVNSITDELAKKKITRRKALSTAGKAAIGVAAVAIVGGAAYFATQQPAGPPPPETVVQTQTVTAPAQTVRETVTRTPATTPGKRVDIDFFMWAFDTPIQESNVAEFSNAYTRDTGIETTARNTSIPYDGYKAAAISRFEGGTKTDVLYVEDNWFSLWENAGWIVPIEEYRPEIRSKYESDLLPGVLDALTSRLTPGKMIGLPYYVDTLTFTYNKKMHEDAGIDEPPKTWEEVLDNATKIKDTVGVDRPLAFAWKQGEWTFEETTFAMLYSRGQGLLNPDGTANLDEGSAMEEVLEWIGEASDRRLLDPKSSEMVSENVLEGMKGRLYAYTVLPSYFLFFTNTSKTPGAGEYINGMMPGNNDTTSLVRFYAMTNMAVEAGDDTIDAAYAFIEWEGGKYDRGGTGERVYIKPREFALRDGLPFGLIGLFDDPAVQNNMQGWIDADLAKEQSARTVYIEAKWELWWERWRTVFEKEVQNVVAGVSTPTEGLGRIRDEFSRLT